MIPPTTAGVACSNPASGIENSHWGASRVTLALSICVSVVCRFPPGSPL